MIFLWLIQAWPCFGDSCDTIRFLETHYLQQSIDVNRFLFMDAHDVPSFHVQLLNRYKQLLSEFSIRLNKSRIRQPPKTIVYPLSGIDVTPLVLYPKAETYIFIDELGSFVRSRTLFGLNDVIISKEKVIQLFLGDREFAGENTVNNALPASVVHQLNKVKGHVHSQSELDFLIHSLDRGIGHFSPQKLYRLGFSSEGFLQLFLSRLFAYFDDIKIHESIAYFDPRQPYHYHGVIRFSLNGDSNIKQVVYIQSAIEEPKKYNETDFIKLGRRHLNYLPLEQLGADAFVFRGSMGVFETKEGNGYLGGSQVHQSFFRYIVSRGAEVLEGRSCLNGGYEMFPKELTQSPYAASVDQTIVNNRLNFSYGHESKGLRAVLMRNK